MERTHVLVVDDEPHIRRVIAAALSLDGWSVEEATDGEDALVRFDARRPDVMLVDLRMPRLDGSGLLRRLAAVKDPPIVVAMSAYAEQEDVVDVMRLGAVDFLPKPFDPTTLRRVMHSALEKEPARAPTTCDEHLSAMKRHARLRRFADAERDVRAAIAVDGKSADAFYYLGVLLELRAAPTEAHAAYEKALMLKPRLVSARRRIAKIDAASARAPLAH